MGEVTQTDFLLLKIRMLLHHHAKIFGFGQNFIYLKDFSLQAIIYLLERERSRKSMNWGEGQMERDKQIPH